MRKYHRGIFDVGTIALNMTMGFPLTVKRFDNLDMNV